MTFSIVFRHAAKVEFEKAAVWYDEQRPGLGEKFNRHAILVTVRKLGFIAITAAPESVSEVDALYFLQPHQGRIVLRHRHRIGVKARAPSV